MTVKPLQCSASTELYSAVEAAAEREGTSVSAWVRMAVEARLKAVETPSTLAGIYSAVVRGDYDDYGSEADVPPKLCRGCDLEFTPHHPAAQYCPECKAEKGPKECQVCASKCQHDLCHSCFSRHRNADWLVRQFIRFKMRKTAGRDDLRKVDQAFRRWAHTDLNVATMLDKADGSPSYHLVRELKEAGYAVEGGTSGGIFNSHWVSPSGNVKGTVTGVSAA